MSPGGLAPNDPSPGSQVVLSDPYAISPGSRISQALELVKDPVSIRAVTKGESERPSVHTEGTVVQVSWEPGPYQGLAQDGEDGESQQSQ